MKHSITLLFLFVCIPILLLNTCDTIPEQNDECEKTKWAAEQKPIIYLYIAVPITNCDKVNSTNATDSATQMICSGSITKIYCDGTVSGSFSFNTTFYPIQMTEQELSEQWVGQAYEFTFQNDKDHLVFVGRLKAYFPGSIIWESEEINLKIYYKDIKLNPNDFQKYCLIALNPALQWFRVSG